MPVPIQDKHLVRSLLLVYLLVCACVPQPYFKEITVQRAYADSPRSILNGHDISHRSRRALKDIHSRDDQTPRNHHERIALAEEAVKTARTTESQSLERAAHHYLTALTYLWPVVRPPQPSEQTKLGASSTIVARQLYNHGSGQLARLLCQQAHIHGSGARLMRGQLMINTTSPHSLRPEVFDSILPLDTCRYGHVGKQDHQRQAFGAAAIGHQKAGANKTKHYFPDSGLNTPINIMVDFTPKGKARITITNLLQTEHTIIAGARYPLSSNYSAAVAATASKQSVNLGLSMALGTKHREQSTGLHTFGYYDPSKIPVIFTHGLISQPTTWTTTTNYLMGDPRIRENYQFFYYFYHTGQSPMLSGAQFRSTLVAFFGRARHHPGNRINQTVLVGHSMGGIISSMQCRPFNDKLWKQLFTHQPEHYSKESAFAQTKVFIDHPNIPQIKRAVFLATPHLGSNMAGHWPGQVGSSIIKLPQSIGSLQLNVLSDNLTDLGRSVLGNPGRPNSITYLKPNNTALTLLSKQPFAPHITYHSIIGDRGIRTKSRSSDGVVPYWSSHLDGAASEKMVPAFHNVQLHPQTHKELKRILLLHLVE